MSDKALDETEQHAIEMIQSLQAHYAKAIEPYLKVLADIGRLRPMHPRQIMLSVDEVRRLQLPPELFDE